MKNLSVTILLLSFVFATVASPVESTTAKNIAITFWNQSSCAAKSGSVHDMQQVTSSTDFSHLYVFTHTHGFVIVAGDDCARPILGFSDESSFNASHIPDVVYQWLKSYDDQIEMAVNQNFTATAEVAAEWSALRAGQVPSMKGTRTVQPLVTAKWGQGSPYNALCPEHLRVGCVAVAMGEIMHFWKYPVQGTGSHSYSDGTHSCAADFGNTTYNWNNMPNTCSGSNNDVATLLYHCGVAVEMEYAQSVSLAYVLNSSAHPYNAENALKTFFGYSQSAHGEYRSDYDKATWMEMLKTDLDAGHPLIYNGYNASNSGGHCFVCDGYNAENYFHFNWGQNGAYDGYFEIDAMTPISSQNFSYNQGAIFSLFPAGTNTIREITSCISIYPNPTSDVVRVISDVDFSSPELRYELYDLSGKLLISNILKSNDEINLSAFAEGVYLLEIFDGESVISSNKIVKK